jgi:thiamine pyrophosphokinase
VIGGEAPPLDVLRDRLHEFAFVCAADSGLDTLAAWGVAADLAVGDFDSLRDASLLARARVCIRFPREKDETDTEIGIRELRARGFGRIVLVGGGGGRVDHLLALRALLEREDGPEEWISPGGRLLRIHEATELCLPPGTLVSVFPLSGGARGMRSRGLRWPLEGLVWDAAGFGLSNVVVSSPVHIEPGPLPLLVVVPLEGKEAP